jgi:hypothetical protein
MITRTTILDLADRAELESNGRLRNLLLTVAGMLDARGKVVSEPSPGDNWGRVSGHDGSHGLGLLYLQNRSRRLDIKAPPSRATCRAFPGEEGMESMSAELAAVRRGPRKEAS